MGDSQAVDPRRRWWDAIRRAFDIPDGESDDNAEAAIARAMIRDGGEFFGVDNTLAVTAMIRAASASGLAGELDDIVRSESYDRGFRTVTDVCDLVYLRAEKLGWPLVKDPHALTKLREATDDLVRKVIESARVEG